MKRTLALIYVIFWRIVLICIVAGLFCAVVAGMIWGSADVRVACGIPLTVVALIAVGISYDNCVEYLKRGDHDK